MAATFGVTNTFGLTPASGHVQESSSDQACEIATIRNSLGVTVLAKAKKIQTRTITISGKGTVNFGQVSAGVFGDGTAVITSAKQSESNDDFPSFEIQAIKYIEQG